MRVKVGNTYLSPDVPVVKFVMSSGVSMVPTEADGDVVLTVTGSGSGGATGVVWLQDYDADNTGADYNDTAFADAITAAVSFLREGEFGWAAISGLPGVYKLGDPALGNPSLAIPRGITFGGFGGGGGQCAQFHFPNETGRGTATGVCGATSTGDTTMAVTSVKNAFAPATPSTPQSVVVWGSAILTYTGITGSGASVTLTGVTGIVGNLHNGGCVGCTAVLCAGSNPYSGWILDRTVEVVGPGTVTTRPAGTTLNGSVTLPQATITLTSTTGFNSGGGIAMIAGPNGCVQISYGGVSGSTLTGCTGGTGTIATGSVVDLTLPAAMDGVYLGGGGKLDCGVGYFRHLTVMMNDHEKWGPNFNPISGYSYVCVESPNASYIGFDSGNQFFSPGINWHGAYWSAFYVTAFNGLLSATIYGGSTGAFSPWHFWKEASKGVTGATGVLASGLSLYDTAFEAPGLGIFGCPDGNAFLGGIIVNCGISWTGNKTTAPGGINPVAEFAVNCQGLDIVGGNMMASTSPEGVAATPFFLADIVVGSIDTDPLALNTFLAGRQVLGMVPNVVTGANTYRFRFPGGVIACDYDNTTIPTKGTLMMTPPGLVNSNYPGVTYALADDGATGSLLGVAIADFGGRASHRVGAVATSQLYGPVSARVKTPGDITIGSLVRSNGATQAGTIANASGIGDTAGIIIGRAMTSDPSTPDGTFGHNSIESTTASLTANLVVGCQFTLSETATFVSVAAYLDGSGSGGADQQLECAVFSDSSGAPATLLARTGVITVTNGAAAAWVTTALASAVSEPAGTYWLMLYGGATNGGARYHYTATGGSSNSHNIGGSFPGNLGNYSGGTPGTILMSIYANYIKGSDAMAQIVISPALA